MSDFPLEVVFDTLLDACKSLIENENDAGVEHRDAVSLFLHNFPVLNRECNSISNEDPTYAAIVYYERIRLKLNVRGFFWECFPHRVGLKQRRALEAANAESRRLAFVCETVRTRTVPPVLSCNGCECATSRLSRCTVT